MNFELKTAYLSPKEVAWYLGVTLRTVYAWIKDGKLRSIRVGNTIRVAESEISGRVNTPERDTTIGAPKN